MTYVSIQFIKANIRIIWIQNKHTQYYERVCDATGKILSYEIHKKSG